MNIEPSWYDCISRQFDELARMHQESITLQTNKYALPWGEWDINLIRELQLRLLHSLETHIHADYVTGGTRFRNEFGCRIGVHRNAHLACADLWLEEGHSIDFGRESLKVLYTPGHTDNDIRVI